MAIETKKTLLVGKGINQHTLYGKFETQNPESDFMGVVVKEKSNLKHEKPNGEWSNEHKTLELNEGKYVMGKQVEWNPWSQTVSRVWD
jgi:hypothetical protein